MFPNYSIIYIISLPYSGSTLLDSLIAAHTQVCSLGEVQELSDYAHRRRPETLRGRAHGNSCTCGAESIWHCSFWKAVDSVLREDASIGLRDLRLDDADPQVFQHHNKLLFDGVARVSGARVIVDSSKSIPRLRGLLKSGIAPVLPIHLVRDPRGQVHSVLKRIPTDAIRPSIHWTTRNLRIWWLLRDHRRLVLRYEEIAADPAYQLRTVMAEVGLDLEPRQLNWPTTERHNLGGNTMRFASDRAVRVDEAWRESLTFLEKMTIGAMTWPANLLNRLGCPPTQSRQAEN